MPNPIIGTHAVDGDRGFIPVVNLADQIAGQPAYPSKMKGLVGLFTQSFQNTRHGQSDTDRFSAPVITFNHSPEVTDV